MLHKTTLPTDKRYVPICEKYVSPHTKRSPKSPPLTPCTLLINCLFFCSAPQRDSVQVKIQFQLFHKRWLHYVLLLKTAAVADITVERKPDFFNCYEASAPDPQFF